MHRLPQGGGSRWERAPGGRRGDDGRPEQPQFEQQLSLERGAVAKGLAAAGGDVCGWRDQDVGAQGGEQHREWGHQGKLWPASVVVQSQ